MCGKTLHHYRVPSDDTQLWQLKWINSASLLPPPPVPRPATSKEIAASKPQVLQLLFVYVTLPSDSQEVRLHCDQNLSRCLYYFVMPQCSFLCQYQAKLRPLTLTNYRPLAPLQKQGGRGAARQAKPLLMITFFQAYRPPGSRGKPAAATRSLLPNVSDGVYKPGSDATRNQPSKQALKNQRKRENRAKQNEEQNKPEPTMQDLQSTIVDEREKKIRNLRKKLNQIEKLKNQVKEGKTLEKNQMDKIATEKDIIDEIKRLEI